MDDSQLKKIIGNHLCEIREGKKNSMYQISKATSTRFEVITKIENGKGYTIDSLIKYLMCQGIYIYFGDKEGNIFNSSLYKDFSIQENISYKPDFCTKIAKDQETADHWLNTFQAIREGQIPQRVKEDCPYCNGTHVHIYVNSYKGNDIIVCPVCFENAGNNEKVL